ncbi:MAG: cysteine hydrolase [Lachnospiraceae bacterium]|nr:cysteine hydrolase [Lachnospiraceae bacterium]
MTLLVIDVQKGITDDRLYNFKTFIENLRKLVDAARNHGVEVIYVQHDDGPGTGFSVGDDEFAIYDEIARRADEKYFYKTKNSCFSNDKLKEYLKEKGDNCLVITGLQTNFCIDASIKSAFDLGYDIVVPKNTNSTFDNDYMTGEITYKYYNEMIWPDRFAKCPTVDETIAMMK